MPGTSRPIAVAAPERQRAPRWTAGRRRAGSPITPRPIREPPRGRARWPPGRECLTPDRRSRSSPAADPPAARLTLDRAAASWRPRPSAGPDGEWPRPPQRPGAQTRASSYETTPGSGSIRRPVSLHRGARACQVFPLDHAPVVAFAEERRGRSVRGSRSATGSARIARSVSTNSVALSCIGPRCCGALGLQRAALRVREHRPSSAHASSATIDRL